MMLSHSDKSGSFARTQGNSLLFQDSEPFVQRYSSLFAYAVYVKL